MTIGRDGAAGGSGHRPRAAVVGSGVAGLTAAYLLDHHGMLRLARSPGWQTVAGGSRCYVEQIAKRLTTVATGVPVRAITRSPGGVAVHDHHRGTREFDAAVIATHPDQALRLLDRPTRAEREVLGAFRYSFSTAVLHTDATLLPRAPAARASWNYRMSDCPDGAEDVRVSYHLNRLQGLDEAREYLVTLNPAAGQVRPERVLAGMTYGHPVYDARSVAAQRHLPGLNTPRPAPAPGISMSTSSCWNGGAP